MGKINHCYNCHERLTRDNQVKRKAAVCPRCGHLTNLSTGQPYKGKVTVKVTRSWMHNHRITEAARTFGQVAFMPEPVR